MQHVSSSPVLSTTGWLSIAAIFYAHLFSSTTDAFAIVQSPAAATHQRGAGVLAQRRSTSTQSAVALFMGKGKNKQLLLKQKLEDAKRQKLKDNANNDDAVGDSAAKKQLTDKEIRERNDRLRFEELLKKGSATVFNDYSSDGYLNKQQEEEEIDAFRKYSSVILVLVADLSQICSTVHMRWTRLIPLTSCLSVTQTPRIGCRPNF